MSRKHKSKGQWWGSRWLSPSEVREASRNVSREYVQQVSREYVQQGGQDMSKNRGSDTFTCSVDGVSACSKAPQVDILFDSRLWQSIVGLCERFNTEWMAYLIGQKDANGDYVIAKLVFPEQTAGGAHVKREVDPEFKPEPNTVGVIHSHVAMQAFFSSTDKAHANWPVEIVVNRKGEYEVSTRVQLPCGESMRRSSRVMLLTGGQLDSMEATLKEALRKGEEKASKQPVVVWSEGYGEYGFRSGSYFGGGHYGTANQTDDHGLLGGRYHLCPIPGCGKYATGRDCCSHTLKEMDEYTKQQESNKAVAP